MENRSSITVVYDGECPLCSRFAMMIRLREQFGQVRLVDARQAHDPLVARLRRTYRLDDGFVVLHEDREYYGAAAMRFLAAATEEKGGTSRLLRAFFRPQGTGSGLYQVLVRGRKLLLRLTGRRFLGY